MKGNGEGFNSAGSSSVKQVDKINTIHDSHDIPMSGEPNSVTKSFQDNKLTQERYYDEDGKAYLDIDYSDHGNPKTHPTVPHQHHISWTDGKPKRGKDGKVE